MRKLLLIPLGIVVLVVLAGVAFLLLPLDSLRGPAEAALSRELGRGVHISGPLHASLYPVIGVSASDVSIDNVPGGQAKEFLQVGTLAIGARLLPLLSRELDITELRLEKPVIHLEVDAAGNPNWAFSMPKGGSASSSPTTAKLSIAGLEIVNGDVTYSDARKGTSKELRAVNARLSLASLNQPAEFTLDGNYDGDEFSVAGSVDSPSTYLAKMPTKVTLDLKSRLVSLHFDGTATGMSDDSGNFSLSGPSLRELMAKGTGQAPSAAGTLGAFSASGAVLALDRVYALKGAKISLDGMNATADLSVDSKGKVPAVTGNIALDHLDLAPYMTGKTNSAPTPGWSTAPIALDGLKRADADIGIAVGRLTLAKLTISKAQLHVRLRAGVLTADLTHAGLFGGDATGEVMADAGGTVPRYAVKLNVDGAEIEQLLDAVMKVDRISGVGTLAVNVTGSGTSQQAIVNSLGGTADIEAKNGAIKGVDLAAVSRTVENALSGSFGAATGQSASTDFAEAGGTFQIANGVAQNRDFHLLNPFIRVTGNGTVNLGPRTIDFHVAPKLVATAQGQGGARNASGISVPFEISGPWTKLSYRPDMTALGGSIVKQVTNGGFGGLLGGLTGRKNGSAPATKQKPALNFGGLLP